MIPENWQLYIPATGTLVVLGIFFAIWIFLPLYYAIKRSGWRWIHAGSLLFRTISAVILFAAFCQLSLIQKKNKDAKIQGTALVLDASQSFDQPQVRKRLKWLQENASVEVCLFGSHKEMLVSGANIEEVLGTHRTSQTDSLKECIEFLKEQDYKPENIVVYTDSRLNWRTQLGVQQLHWVHQDGATRSVDLGVQSLVNEELFFKGTENQAAFKVLARGVSGATPLGVYSPRGLIKTLNIEPTSEWKTVTLTLSQQDAVSLSKGMPLLLRFPKLASEGNHDNNETLLYPLWAPHKIKVLHVSGSPSTDTFYFRRWLKSQVNFDVISFYILKDFNNDNSVPQNEISLIPFPVEKLFGTELDKFNVVILQNFEWSSFLKGQLVRRLKRYLRTPGKGLFLLGGPRAFKGRDLSNNDLRSLLPFRDRNRSWSVAPSYESYFGGGSWVWAKNFPIRNALPAIDLISRYPAFDALNDLDINPRAQPWAGFKQKNGRTRWVAASQEFGEGRVLMVISDQMFRWVLEASDLDLGDLYGQFIENSLAWLSFNYESNLENPLWPQTIFRGESFRVARHSKVKVQCDSEATLLTSATWTPQKSGFCKVISPRRQWVYMYDHFEEKTLRSPSPEELKKRMSLMGATLYRNLGDKQWRHLLQRSTRIEGQVIMASLPLWTLPALLMALLVSFILDWALRRRGGLR